MTSSFQVDNAMRPPARRSSAGTFKATLLLRAVGICFVIAWAVIAWSTLRPREIVSDWNSVRQADTQTIAVNLTRDGANMLWPQVACGGDGPGYVETELQLYSQLMASLMGPFGTVEWIGQIISLLATVGTAFMIWIHLERRYGLLGALFGALAFLAQRTATHLATVVMPDALALFAYVVAWAAFHRYTERSQLRDLLLFALFGAVAMMQKPTMAQIGVSSFVLLAVMGRKRLADYKVWVAWAVMVLVFVAFMTHAHNLYLEYGNTFGVLFGQDGKAPHFRHLLMPHVLWGAVLNAGRWGYGPVGLLALVAIIALRRVEAEHVALGAGNVLITLLALRYMSQDAGNYYFAPANLLACSAIASVANAAITNLSGWKKPVALTTLGLALTFQLVRNVEVRQLHANFPDPQRAAVVATGKQLRRFVQTGDLVVVRAPYESYDTFWDWPARLCEPRIFLLSGTRGWTFDRDADPQRLADATARGARYFVDLVPDENAGLSTFLMTSADLVWSERGIGKIWRLRPRNEQ